ncbi:MAG TPA: hypothetical protein VMU04_24710 [Candidatus Acidoferrum sp.]|nr:hypothetical protein [Candidatus Acidoferrum sp.]
MDALTMGPSQVIQLGTSGTKGLASFSPMPSIVQIVGNVSIEDIPFPNPTRGYYMIYSYTAAYGQPRPAQPTSVTGWSPPPGTVMVTDTPSTGLIRRHLGQRWAVSGSNGWYVLPELAPSITVASFRQWTSPTGGLGLISKFRLWGPAKGLMLRCSSCNDYDLWAQAEQIELPGVTDYLDFLAPTTPVERYGIVSRWFLPEATDPADYTGTLNASGGSDNVANWLPFTTIYRGNPGNPPWFPDWDSDY